jgi:hypothetical protein
MVLFGGEGGIRTHEPRKGSPVFKTGAFNRSATSPNTSLAPSLVHERDWSDQCSTVHHRHEGAHYKGVTLLSPRLDLELPALSSVKR